ncbi:MAG: hypothetical protein HY597_06125 [Candidatus Omnitrophica bacterium]|nr:hypothetical protein [Candidatus Omnitrophota bacterium]
MKSASLIIIGSLLCAPLAWAEPSSQDEALRRQVDDLTKTVEGLQQTVQEQQRQIMELQRAKAQLPSAPASTPVAAAPAPARGTLSSLSAFNPEIGVLADVVGQLSESSADGEGNDKLSAREMELVLGHAIDPYSRLDVTVAFSDFEEASLEEAYLTHWGLPWNLKARLGRMRPKIGKAAPLHRDSLDTVDEPLVVDRYFGHEGLSRTGAELSWFAPWSAGSFTQELTGGILEGGVGEGGTLLGSTRRRPSFYAHLKNFWDVNDTTNIEVGTTYLIGSKDADAHYEVNAFGLDGTLVHFVTPTNKLKWQSEAYLQDRKESADFNRHPWGFYSLVDYRLSPRFGVGGRFDWVEPVDLDPATRARDADTAWSGYLTLYQSEFARWRLQLRHTNFASGGDDNTIFAQGTVAIGVHKHQLQ